MEIRDLYDINRNLTGETIAKGEPIPDGKYIAVVLAFIQNSEGNFLIQKRSTLKDGKLGATSGHLETGETSMQGLIREIKEELGLDVMPEDLKLLYSGKSDKRQFFFDIYYLKKDININNLSLQKEEVERVEWHSLAEIKTLVENGLFSDSHAEVIPELLNLLKNLH